MLPSITSWIEWVKPLNWLSQKEDLGCEIVRLLYENKMILTWYRDKPSGWHLHSGKWSPFYIHLRELSSYPELLRKVGYSLNLLIKQEIPDIDLIVGLAMTGIPIATAISLEGSIPAAFTRKVEGGLTNYEETIEKYGKHSLVEGQLDKARNAVLLDDLVSYFTSKLEGLKLLEYEIRKRDLKNLKIHHVLVLLDREQGGYEEARKHNIDLHSLIPFKSKGIHWLKDVLHKVEYDTIKDYLENPEHFQEDNVQNKLSQLCPSSTD